MKKILCMLFIALTITGCSKGVKQEAYDALLTKNILLEQSNEELTTKASALQKAIDSFESDALKKAKEELSKIHSFSISEIKADNKSNILQIWYTKDTESANNEDTVARALGAKISEFSYKDWFDYDTVIIDVWGTGVGRLVTMTYDTHSQKFDSHNFYE